MLKKRKGKILKLLNIEIINLKTDQLELNTIKCKEKEKRKHMEYIEVHGTIENAMMSK